MEAAQPYVGSKQSQDRMAELHRLCRMAGYKAPPTIFPEGTPLIDIGEQNLARERARVDSLPLAKDFAASFCAVEAARGITDTPARLVGLRMLDNGKLQRMKDDGTYGGPVAVTPTGLEQLVSMHRGETEIPGNFVTTLKWALSGNAQDVREGAALFNQMVRRVTMAKGEKAQLTTPRIFRTAQRLDTGERYLFAVTSPKHVGVSGGFASLVSSLGRYFPDAKVSATHQGHDRLDLELVFPMMAREIRVGDVLWGTLGVTLSEAKDVSASVWDSLMRVLCVNLTRADFGAKDRFTHKHMGKDFARVLVGRLHDGWQRLQPFVAAFGDASVAELPFTRAEAVERLVKAFPEPMKALPGESVMLAWDMDGERSQGETLGGLVNAVTRASKTLGVSDAQEVERMAGELVMRGVNALGAPTSALALRH